MKNCIECGQEFDPRAPNQTYCGYKCRKSVQNIRRYERQHGELPEITGCQFCGAGFEPKHRGHRFCSQQCVNRNRLGINPQFIKQPHPVTLECVACGNEFLSDYLTTQYCGDRCRYELSRRRILEKRALEGYYIYAWYDGDELFYIGKGCDNRATVKHEGPCEERRAQAKEFRVEVLRGGIEESVALEVEACLITILKPSCNIALTRQIPG